jgi:hypothetical protein
VTFDPGSQLEEIEPWAFAGCWSLRDICLPAKLSKIDGKSFLGSSFPAVTIESGNRHFCVMDGYLMDKELTLIIRYFGSAQDPEIPNQVQRLVRCSFENCQDIVSIACGPTSKLLRIEKRAFSKCNFLKSVNLPPSVQKLKKTCFSDCKRLDVVTFARDSKFESIGKHVFSGYLSLLSILLPSSVRKLNAGCFLGCTGP